MAKNGKNCSRQKKFDSEILAVTEVTRLGSQLPRLNELINRMENLLRIGKTHRPAFTDLADEILKTAIEIAQISKGIQNGDSISRDTDWIVGNF